jgi:hypothetical protein
MKSPFPIFAGWLGGAAAASTAILLFSICADQFRENPRFTIGQLPSGLLFWSLGVAIAMIPGILICAVIYYRTHWLRDKHAWLRVGLYGVIVMWAWSIPLGFGHRIVEGYQVALLLGIGAFLASSVFWYLVVKLEKKAEQGGAPNAHPRHASCLSLRFGTSRATGERG